MKIFAQLPNLFNQLRKKIIDIAILKSVILYYDQFLQCCIWTVCNGRLVNRRIGFHFYLISADRLKTVGFTYTVHKVHTIKTPNHKCRLYWCKIEFVHWR